MRGDSIVRDTLDVVVNDETARRLREVRQAVEAATGARTAALADRDVAILEARAAGALQREIAELLGVPHLLATEPLVLTSETSPA